VDNEGIVRSSSHITVNVADAKVIADSLGTFRTPNVNVGGHFIFGVGLASIELTTEFNPATGVKTIGAGVTYLGAGLSGKMQFDENNNYIPGSLDGSGGLKVILGAKKGSFLVLALV